jgi:hypothetical protein
METSQHHIANVIINTKHTNQHFLSPKSTHIRNNCHWSTCFQLNFVVILQKIIGSRSFDDHLTSIYLSTNFVRSQESLFMMSESLILPNQCVYAAKSVVASCPNRRNFINKKVRWTKSTPDGFFVLS